MTTRNTHPKPYPFRKYRNNGTMWTWCPQCYPHEPCTNAVFSRTFDAEGNPIWAHDEFHPSDPQWRHISDCTYTLPRKLATTGRGYRLRKALEAINAKL